jgi:hypothetical protein
MLGKAGELRAWSVPAELFREGRNTLEVTMTSGPACSILFIDLDQKGDSRSA